MFSVTCKLSFYEGLIYYETLYEVSLIIDSYRLALVRYLVSAESHVYKCCSSDVRNDGFKPSPY